MVANSTFSWWAHFFRQCRKYLTNWSQIVALAGTDESQAKAQPSSAEDKGTPQHGKPRIIDSVPQTSRATGTYARWEGIGVSLFPHRWYSHDKRLKKQRQKLFDFLPMDVMVVDIGNKILFEGIEDS